MTPSIVWDDLFGWESSFMSVTESAHRLADKKREVISGMFLQKFRRTMIIDLRFPGFVRCCKEGVGMS